MSLEALEDLVTPAPLSGNTQWAANYAQEIRGIVNEASRRAPRSQQVHLGPSEIGTLCDRQIVGKLTRAPKKNVMGDPWPSVVGTSVHAWLETILSTWNELEGRERFLTEQKVEPHPDHAGTGDLYDVDTDTVGDHKVLGAHTLNKLRRNGPPRKYEAQLYLYAKGFEFAGYSPKRVALIAYPRTESTLDGMYVWEHPWDSEARDMVDDVLSSMDRRKNYAALVEQGYANLYDIPATPSDDDCTFCPLFRRDATPGPDGEFRGCPGR